MDAWEIITAAAADTSDAWAALNSQSGSTIGAVIDELRFTLQPVIQMQGALSPLQMTGATNITSVAGYVQEQSVSGTVAIMGLTGIIAVQEM